MGSAEDGCVKLGVEKADGEEERAEGRGDRRDRRVYEEDELHPRVPTRAHDLALGRRARELGARKRRAREAEPLLDEAHERGYDVAHRERAAHRLEQHEGDEAVRRERHGTCEERED